MLMDSSFYYAAFHDEAAFYPHGAAPPPVSPELPFGLIASPGEPPQPGAYQDYCGTAGPELLPQAGAWSSPHGDGGGGGLNVQRRGIDALGGVGPAPAPAHGDQQPMEEHDEEEPRRRQQRQPGAVESSRGFRHMMRERQRREKLSQSYADLYAMVAARSKGDKNSIVQSAAIYIHELRAARDQLRRRNEELKARILGHVAGRQCVKVQFEVDEPPSAIDSMIGALRRLKSMDVRARGIRSSMSGRRLWTEMNVETTIAAGEVEKAVEEALLKEVERNQRSEPGLGPDIGAAPPGFPGNGGSSGGPASSSHVQNVS